MYFQMGSRNLDTSFIIGMRRSVVILQGGDSSDYSFLGPKRQISITVVGWLGGTRYYPVDTLGF